LRPLLRRSPEDWCAFAACREPLAVWFFGTGQRAVPVGDAKYLFGDRLAIFLFLTERASSPNRNMHMPDATTGLISGFNQDIGAL